MASPSTTTLRSGTAAFSRFSGGGALEKFSIRFGACCWNGANRSPPNQPPPPPPYPPLRGGGRGGPPKLGKLKNWAEAGPTIPTSSAIATASATSGPVSVNTRKNEIFLCMRLGRNRSFGNSHNSGIGPQAGRFPHHKPGIRRRRQGHRGNVVSKVSGGRREGRGLPPPPPPPHRGGGKYPPPPPPGGPGAPEPLPRPSPQLAIRGTAIQTAPDT